MGEHTGHLAGAFLGSTEQPGGTREASSNRVPAPEPVGPPATVLAPEPVVAPEPVLTSEPVLAPAPVPPATPSLDPAVGAP
jgi:hypothetical protein